ncbi:MAG: DUF1611 domain-containing protein [Desulfobacteraceae bacterium]|nr:MAG: DUF1611 domain-containing protein [Desulfobacteraceae bacterium]
MPMDGNAIVYCEGAFDSTYGKTAHGLVRFTLRYRVLSVVDSRCRGRDAGAVLDGKPNGIPIWGSVEEAIGKARERGISATHLVIGLATDGGKLDDSARRDVLGAVAAGLHVDCGLHDFLSEDPEVMRLAGQKGVSIRDVRKPPPRSRLHFFSGKIEQVDAFRIAMLGTDSAVGKRTTAWLLVQGFRARGISAEMIGTGQTAWMQGAAYGLILDALVNDFVSGEIEHAAWTAWQEKHPDVLVLEGQGSLMNPAYPGGFEILAAGRPDIVILQHAPSRRTYDGFPDYPMHPLAKQIQAVELLSGRPVVAITVNHEGIPPDRVPGICEDIRKQTGLPAFDVLLDGPEALLDSIQIHIDSRKPRLPGASG